MNVVSKFLAVLLLSIASVLSMQGMNPCAPEASSPAARVAEGNCVQLLGEPLVNPSDVPSRQKLDKDAAEAKAKKEAAPKKRSILDGSLIGKIAQKMPAKVWERHCAPFLDNAKQLLPVHLEPIQAEPETWTADRSRYESFIYNTFNRSFSRDGRFVVLEPKRETNNSSKKNIKNIEDIEIYDAAAGTLVHEARDVWHWSFSNDSHFCAYNTQDETTIVDLRSKQATQLAKEGSDFSFSPDSKLFAFVTCSTFIFNPISRLIIVDLETKKELINFEIDNIDRGDCVFSHDGSMLRVQQHAQSIYLSDFKGFFLDISVFKDKKFQDARTNKLTPKQSTLLMMLEEVQKKNDGSPISLLHDVALKRMASLKELQATLASFHPLIRDGIIKRYHIIDPTPEAYKQHKTQKDLDNKRYWTNVAKITGFATLVGALAVKWLYSKK